MTTRSKRVAAGRPRYQQDLAQGLERFFEPRQATCPWCGSGRLHQRLRTADCLQRKPGTFALDQCGNCRHVFQNPRLNAAGLEFYYRDCYDGLGEATMTRMASSPIAIRLYRARARALPPPARPRRWLDVGTGHGHFCAVARTIHPDTEFDGLDIGQGVEIAARHGRIARAYRGAFTELSRQLAGHYDVVSMHHYLEHTVAPRQELAAAHTALRPGGHLLVEVPDPQSAAARLFGRWWGPWLQPQHLHFLPLENLCGALTAQGFTVVATDRREPHVPTDLTSAAANVLSRLLPSADVPWLPEKPGLLSRTVRPVSLLAGAPLLAALFGLDLLLAPVARGTRFANAYRVVARRD
ncbi:SAM-dependent methyltransferase [Streptomyces olivoverticillatus]|uniref:SAM-dependent methyltransferase n=1 Tax=Streptomyces olivoverticillatus TaxID=66427 RepID=A0A7W7PKL8_9ACTN|nr:class I SAM-dependent methyltransferase [Streptomyces olivoverticillatus]MBB4893357.1 SAM-dependent methyltransferase [Streptomyces olivoverticillatus]